MCGRWDSRITLEITGLHEISGSDYGIEEAYWKPSAKSTPYLKPWRNLDLPYVKIIKLTKQSWSFHSFRGLTRLGKNKGLTKKKRSSRLDLLRLRLSALQNLVTFLDPTLQRLAGWQAIQSIYSNHKDLSVESELFNCLLIMERAISTAAVSRGEQWLHVCNIYTDRS